MNGDGRRGGVGLRLALLPVAFAIGAGGVGIAISWLTSYVLPPTEEKWAQSPEIAFQISCLFSALMAVAGGALFGVSTAVWVLAAKRALGEGPTWHATASGALYSVVLLGGGDTLVRLGAGNVVGPVLVGSLVVVVPALLSLSRYRRARLA